MYQIWYIGIFIFKFFSRQLLFHHFMCYWNENSVQKLHNKLTIKPLWFVPNGEILNFRQTFLEITLIFAKKCTLYRERGVYDTVNRNFTTVGVSICLRNVRLVWKQKIFLIGYLRFEEKMYVVIWRVYFSFTKNLQSHIWSIAKNLSVVKWEESSKLCLDFLDAEKLTKSLHSHTRSFGENLSV